MKVIIETERLLLRKFSLNDVRLVLALNQNPAVTRFTGDLVSDISQAKAYLETRILPQYALYNYGRWAVLNRQTLDFMGGVV
jgi:RimJ/RimL family protein N-acetyltransferase